jgi:YegS/Rv2252/BmrU family lipid kinase
MKVRFIVNPLLGGRNRAGEITEIVAKVFSTTRGVFEVRTAEKKGDCYLLSKEAADKGYSTVFACGGDGTVNEVASALVNTDTVLGVVPSGSGNALARALGIPFDSVEALSLPLGGHTKKIDVGRADDRFFFSTAGAGLDAVISKIYADRMKDGRKRGIMAYLPISLTGYLSYRVHSVLIKCDETYMRVNPLFITVANTAEYGAGAVIAPGATPDDGLFDVCIVEKRGFLNALRVARRLFGGDIRTLKNFRMQRAKRVELAGTGGVIQLDGEPLECAEPVILSVLPEALKVWVK